MTKDESGQIDVAIPNVELVIEHNGWENEIADIESLSVAICNSTMNRFESTGPTIAILLADNAAIQKLNLQWRGQDKPTNVLSFPNIDHSFVLGDIALAFEYCKAEAQAQGKLFKNHFTHLLIHGVLHLLGYDHIIEAEAEEMESIEAEILRDFGIADPYVIIDDNYGRI